MKESNRLPRSRTDIREVGLRTVTETTDLVGMAVKTTVVSETHRVRDTGNRGGGIVCEL